jgi:ferritin-like metal-binding protein YciE
MKFLSENLKNLRELYFNQLRVLLSAERQIVWSLQTMMDSATDQQLKQAFESHLQETEVHATRLHSLLERAGESTEPIKCRVMLALEAEAEDMIQDARDLEVRDAALIAAAQRIEHYEIAAYGTVRRFAELLGDVSAAETLDKTIKEEGYTDHLLTAIADRVNQNAQKAA